MSDQTILVKKSDGTAVRMTLAEFRAYQEALKAPAPAPAAPVLLEDHTEQDLPVVQIKTQRVAPPFVPSWNKSDHASLLQETLDAVSPHASLSTAPRRTPHVERVMKALSFSVPSELSGRLETLIESRLKEIRTDDQLTEYATRDTAHGGIGLSAAAAAELVQKIRVSAPAPKREPPKQAVRLPSKETRPVPAHTPEVPRAPSTQTYRPTVRDVEPPVLTPSTNTVGPVDELKLFSLTDFRRLSTVPHQAELLLKQKFFNLKDEWYFFYLAALAAWKTSPLMREYLDAVLVSLTSQRHLQEITAQKKDGISFDECMALLNVNIAVDV